MTDNNDNYEYANRLLGGLLESESDLRERFDKRIIDLGLSQRRALAELDIELRALNGMLNGTQRMVDLLALSRLAVFLQIPIERLVNLLLDKLEKNFLHRVSSADSQEFIVQNFDLVKLKKCGFIDSTGDFAHIEQRLLKYLGLKSIQDYGKDSFNVAYSDGKPKAKSLLMRSFWVESAAAKLRFINNQYDYNRNRLIEHIPSIRWQTTNVERGLFQVIRELFKIGVTVIFEPYVSTLYARGATFAINDKPCIVLTNYSSFYPSLWFALLHELHHVLFDWDEISASSYHISEQLDKYALREVEADDFAREFFFPREKLRRVIPEIKNQYFIEQYAKANNVHESVIYTNYCWEQKEDDKAIFSKFRELIPDVFEAVKSIDSNAVKDRPWANALTAKDHAKDLLKGIFNGL